MARRLQAMGNPRYRAGFDVTLHEDLLEAPLRWKKPRRVFVCSMADLFHDDVPEDFIGQAFETMAAAAQHTFQVLTKRPARAAWMLRELYDFWRAEPRFRREGGPKVETPLANVWVGTSVENQKTADKRIPRLLDVEAAVRFLSCEPLLGPIDFMDCPVDPESTMGHWSMLEEGIDWVIVGGESGPNARRMEAGWVRMIRDQCIDAGVPFFFKQWGGRFKGRAGRTLDGRTWDQMP
jgi:protein gp37